MRVGLYANPQDASDRTAAELRDGVVRMARAADEADFDHLSAGQHYLSDFTQLQLLPTLARLTGEVSDVEIGTGVVLLPFHHPVDLAERIATLDALHDGPTVFGAGAGYREPEFRAFGIPEADRFRRTMECFDLATRLLTEESVTFEGEQFAVEDASIPVRPDPDDLTTWLAANADRAVSRAAKYADAWFVNPHATISEICEQKVEHYDPIREKRGEDTWLPVFREAFVAPTHEAAVDTAREHLWEKYQRYLDWGQDEAMEDTDDLHRPFEELAEDRFVLGTPAEVCAEIERYEADLDAELVVFRVHWPGLDYDDAVECVELIGDEVIPHV